MAYPSKIIRALAVMGLTVGLLTVAPTPGLSPQPAEALLTVGVPTRVQRVVAGDGFICASVTADNATRVMCSGKNSDGQLGDGTTTDRSFFESVSNWRHVDGTRQMVAGKSHVCAISGLGSTIPPGQGTLYCWGDNQYGQLGTGTNTDSTTPVAVASNAGFTNAEVKAVMVGDHHTCAVQNVNSQDKLYCWGRNNKGQLGDTTTTDRNRPVAVQGIFATEKPFVGGVNAKQPMAAGAEHTCAQVFDNARKLYCWGENQDGQLGNNSTTDSTTPVNTNIELISAGGTFTSFIAAGSNFTCARDNAGAALCWGDNSKGQMGNGNTTDVLVPTAVPSHGGFTNSNSVNTIVAGAETVCMQDASRIVWCWGANNAGQVGDNTQVDRNRPTRVSDNAAEGFTNGQLGGTNNEHAGIAVGNSVTDGFACITGWCWGGNSSGQLALNNTTRTPLATRMLVGTRTPDDVPGVTATAVFTNNSVVVTINGLPSTGMNSLSVTVAPTTRRLSPGQPFVMGAPSYGMTSFSGGTLPTMSGGSVTFTVPNMPTSVMSMNGPPVNGTENFVVTGSYHLTYLVQGSAAAGYPDGWRARNGQVAGDEVTVTGTTPAASSATAGGSTAAAPATPATGTPTTGTPAAGTQTAVGSYANAIPGVTVTDPKVYTAAPAKVADNSAIAVLTPTQARTMDIRSLTPNVCLPNDEDIVFIDEGRCIAQVVREKTRAVVRTLRTTVVSDDIADLKVGNEVAVLAPLYFKAGTAEFRSSSLARLQQLRPRIEAAGSVLIAGHTGNLMGNTPENVALARARAQATVAALKARGSKGPFAIAAVGALDPVSNGTTRQAQDRNRRSVIVLIP